MEFSDSDIGEFAFSPYSVKCRTAESTQTFLTLLQLTFYNLQFLLHKHSSSRSGRKFTYKTKKLQKNLQNSKTLFFQTTRSMLCITTLCFSMFCITTLCLSIFYGGAGATQIGLGRATTDCSELICSLAFT